MKNLSAIAAKYQDRRYKRALHVWSFHSQIIKIGVVEGLFCCESVLGVERKELLITHKHTQCNKC